MPGLHNKEAALDTIYRLEMKTPLHVGSTGIGKEGTLAYMPSDTLFAAMVATWAWVAPQRLEETLALFSQGAPPFVLTSAFPYVGPVRLYPAPTLDAPLPAAAHNDLGKKLKQLTHVSEQILRGWLAGNDLSGELTETVVKNGQRLTVSNFLQGERVWVSSQERKDIAKALSKPAEEPATLRLWSEEIAPHVVVGRVDNRPNLFHTGRVYFARRCGLWFGVRYADPQRQGDVEQALNLLADSGMGGLRSAGHGAFKWTSSPAVDALPAPRPGDYGLLLSRLAPTASQMGALTADHANYRLATVGGWCGNDGEEPRKRRRVRLVAEGSVVQWPDSSLGHLVDVNPTGGDGLDHPVYRCGYGLAVAVGDKALEVNHE